MRRLLISMGMACLLAAPLWAQAEKPASAKGQDQPAATPAPRANRQGQQGRPAANPAQMRAQMEERLNRGLDQMGLTATEKTAVQAAVREKVEARMTLMEQLRTLRTAAHDVTSDAQATQAIERYRAAQRTYEQRVQQIDQALMAKVSPKVQLRLLAAGVVDNGLGGAGVGQRRAPGMGGGPGAAGIGGGGQAGIGPGPGAPAGGRGRNRRGGPAPAPAP